MSGQSPATAGPTSPAGPPPTRAATHGSGHAAQQPRPRTDQQHPEWPHPEYRPGRRQSRQHSVRRQPGRRHPTRHRPPSRRRSGRHLAGRWDGSPVPVGELLAGRRHQLLDPLGVPLRADHGRRRDSIRAGSGSSVGVSPSPITSRSGQPPRTASQTRRSSGPPSRPSQVLVRHDTVKAQPSELTSAAATTRPKSAAAPATAALPGRTVPGEFVPGSAGQGSSSRRATAADTPDFDLVTVHHIRHGRSRGWRLGGRRAVGSAAVMVRADLDLDAGAAAGGAEELP